MNLKLDLKISDFAKENMGDNVIEEPVSPPACKADEGPPLIFSQSIEDIAREVVDENRRFKSAEKTSVCETQIPKVVELIERNPFTPLIPATVCDISEDPSIPNKSKQSPTLHMSGGMVSTDMTLNISSVPTSVITNNTSTSVTVKGDQGIDNILQYFRSQNQTMATDNTQGILPLDLSVRNVVEGSSSLPKSLDTGICNLGIRKRKRDENPLNENGNLLYDGKRQMVALQNKAATLRFEEKKPEHKAKVEKVKERDTEIIMQKNQELDNNREKNKKENEKKKVLPEKAQCDKLKNGNDFACRLVLPKKREEKAKIVFPNGLHVEIDRSMFHTLEQQILGKRQKISTKTASQNRNASKRQKKIQRSDKKKQAPLANPGKLKTDLKKSPKFVPHIEKYDTKPKDMPLIVEEEYFTTHSTETKDQNGISESRMTPPPTPPPTSPINQPYFSPSLIRSSPPPSPKFTTPPPSNPSSPPGLHKLPSVVSKPSYYTKYENRKILKVK